MWTCSEIRQAARSRIQLSLWPVVLVTFIYLAIVSLLPSISYGLNTIMNVSVQRRFIGFGELIAFSSLMTGVSSIIGFAQLILAFLMFNPMFVGYNRYLGSVKQKSNDIGSGVRSLFWAFREGRFSGVVSGTAWKQLWMMIWSLGVSMVVVVPTVIIFGVMIISAFSGFGIQSNHNDLFDVGTDIFRRTIVWLVVILIYVIVAGVAVGAVLLNRKYAYLFTEFILAERTDMPAKAAIDLSKQMTRGMKMDLFVLDLSFIGWYILSALTLFILQLWVFPYQRAAYLEVYNRRKAEIGVIINPSVQQAEEIGQTEMNGVQG